MNVTILGYGAMGLRRPERGPAITDEQAARILNGVLDSGINLIDTAIDYGDSEELIGRSLFHRREEFFLASKCGCPLVDPPPGTPGPPYPHDYSRDNIRAGLDQSLRRLRTDHLDLLQVHMSPSAEQMAADDTVATLQELRDEGKIRFIGISGLMPNLPDHIAMGVFDVFQIPYSVLQREHEELITAAAKAGAGTLIRGGAARGAPAADKGWAVSVIGLADGQGQHRWESANGEELLGDMSRMEFVLRFTLSHPDLSTTIVGTINPDHLASNVAIAEKGPLPAELYDLAKQAFAS